MSSEKVNWSASRFGCFNQCKIKYRASYINSLSVYNRPFDLSVKGTCFHEIAQNTTIEENELEVSVRAKKTIDSFEFDKEKYPVEKSIPVFYKWWTTYIVPLVKNGFEMYKECWKHDTFHGVNFVGAVDLYLVNKTTKEIYIFDYKSSSSPHMDDYANQLVLYAWVLAREYKIPDEEIADKIHCALFFPLAGIKTLNIDDDKAVEKQMLKDILELPLSTEYFKQKINSLESIVDESHSTNWEAIDTLKEAKISFTCNFCEFSGSSICPYTAQAGVVFPRNAAIVSQPESKCLKALDDNDDEALSKFDDVTIEKCKEIRRICKAPIGHREDID